MSPENILEYQLGMACNELTILYDCAMTQQLAIMSDEELISGKSVKMGYAEIEKTALRFHARENNIHLLPCVIILSSEVQSAEVTKLFCWRFLQTYLFGQN